jgi:hypothetical protein
MQSDGHAELNLMFRLLTATTVPTPKQVGHFLDSTSGTSVSISPR